MAAMLVEPSTRTVVPLGTVDGKGNDVGVGDCAKAGTVVRDATRN